MSDTAGQPGVEGRGLAYAAWCVLLAMIAVVTVGGFALTFHGLYGYGLDLAQLGRFAALVPVMVDGLTLVAILATFLLAHIGAPLRPRAYAWFAFAIANGASVAGNASFAQQRHLAWQGALGAALCPVFVTIAAHLAICVWRHWMARPPVRAAAQNALPAAQRDVTPDGFPPPDPAEQPAAQPVRTARPAPAAHDVPLRIRPPAPFRATRPAGEVDRTAQREQVRTWWTEGLRTAQILARFNGDAPSRRTVENWTRDLRELPSQAKADAAAEMAALTGGAGADVEAQ